MLEWFSPERSNVSHPILESSGIYFPYFSFSIYYLCLIFFAYGCWCFNQEKSQAVSLRFSHTRVVLSRLEILKNLFNHSSVILIASVIFVAYFQLWLYSTKRKLVRIYTRWADVRSTDVRVRVRVRVRYS